MDSKGIKFPIPPSFIAFKWAAAATMRSHLVSMLFGQSVLTSPPLLLRRRVNYKLINRPARLGDPLIRGDVKKQENKGLFLSRCVPTHEGPA
jgi:hypothetical protein